uniref:Reverse transcriptase domain-containing protein n=2 Tax=Micrurus lemniscatus lemniscatus TaxID=129467 RepID=A0A2D4HSU8_MICLE
MLKKVNWEFMRQQVKEMKFGDKFEKMLESIYSSQEARVIINGEMTNSFEIEKGVRQGCPLSPLLFITTLETLLRKIRQKMEIKGLRIKNEEYKTQAFADDLVFFVEEPIN